MRDAESDTGRLNVYALVLLIVFLCSLILLWSTALSAHMSVLASVLIGSGLFVLLLVVPRVAQARFWLRNH